MPPINAFVVSSPKIRLIARKYRISEYLLTSLNIHDENVIRRVAIANKMSIDRETFEAHAVASNRIELFNRPEAVRFNSRRLPDSTEVVDIIMRFKTTTVIWTMEKSDYNKYPPEHWLEQLSITQ